MKKKIIALLLAALMIAPSLASCKRGASTTAVHSTKATAQTPAQTLGSSQAAGVTTGGNIIVSGGGKKMIQACVATAVLVYNDTIYYNCYSLSASIPTKIKYQNLNNIRPSGAELGADPLSSESLGGLFAGVDEWPFFLVDEEATAENGGIPVFIICCNYSGVYKIFSYNSKDNKVNTIHTELENMHWLALYGDYIFYVTNEGDKGWIIHRVKKDGTGYAEMENKDALSHSIHFIYEDKIYYSQGSKKIYSMNLDFSGSEYICDALVNPSPFIADGYIYYFAVRPTPVGDGTNNAWELCRRNLTDLSKEETVIKDIGVGMHRNGIFYYFKYNSDGTAYNKNTIYGYKVKTGESFVALDNPAIQGGFTYLGWNEEYLVCRFTKDRKSYYLVVNIETGEEFTMQAAK